MKTTIIIKWDLIKKRNNGIIYADLVQYESSETIIMADLDYIVKAASVRNYLICNMQEVIFEAIAHHGYNLIPPNTPKQQIVQNN